MNEHIEQLKCKPCSDSASFHMLEIILGPQFTNLFFNPVEVMELILPFPMAFSLYLVNKQIVRHYNSLYHCSCKPFNDICLINKSQYQCLHIIALIVSQILSNIQTNHLSYKKAIQILTTTNKI